MNFLPTLSFPSHISSYLVSNLLTIRYITNVYFEEQPNIYLIVSRDACILIVPQLEFQRAKQDAFPFVTVEAYSANDPRSEVVSHAFANISLSGCISYNPMELSVYELQNLKNSLRSYHFVSHTNVFETIRAIKSEKEIAAIRSAAQLTSQAYESAISKIDQTSSEVSIQKNFSVYCLEHDGSTAFTPIIASGKNAALPHYVSQKQLIHLQSEAILCDCGASFNGYMADMSRMILPVNCDSTFCRAYKTVYDTLQKVLEILHTKNPAYRGKSGDTISASKLDKFARQCIIDAGFSDYPHALGHGVGLAIHEYPLISFHSEACLEDGMVLAIEPGIYCENSFGIRLEQTVLLTKNGIEVLTTNPIASL